jgi:hypothetical protein
MAEARLPMINRKTMTKTHFKGRSGNDGAKRVRADSRILAVVGAE